MRRAINDRPYGLRLRLFAKLLFTVKQRNAGPMLLAIDPAFSFFNRPIL